jgi:glycolate oxidase FAD binding subunit
LPTACAPPPQTRPLCAFAAEEAKLFLPAQPHAASGLIRARSSGIVSYEPSELVITARAGTPLAELEAALAEQNQCLPFEPPHFGPGATVGGMVAAGLSGPARASVGAVRDYMLGVSIINGRGEPLTFGGQVMKNVAGYDVSRLMAGSWGSWGSSPTSASRSCPWRPPRPRWPLNAARPRRCDRLHAWGGQPLPLNASCWVEDGGAARLYVRLRGAVAAVEAACRSMGGERWTRASVPADWQDCREQRLPWFAQRAPQLALWRLSLPQTAPVLALPPGVAAPLVEWHGALRWVQAGAEHGMRCTHWRGQRAEVLRFL